MADFKTLLQEHFGAAYRIERELSGGGMSQVVLAQDVQHNRRVVIKLLPPSLGAAISAERFEREVMLSAALQHPNIVPVLSSGKMNGLPYFIMPFIEGESVRARVRRGPLSVRETVNILKDVTRALVFAHQRGIIHRDIKPDNVLLSAGAGAAVVTDFGVAKAISASRHVAQAPAAPGMTGAGISLGTPAYMAPEQAAADPNVDHRADIYALGTLAYEMLAGAPPFTGRSPQQLLAAQMTEAPPALHARRYDIPKALNDVIMRCLAKLPGDRPESAAALLRQLEAPEIVSGAFAAPGPSNRQVWRLAGVVAGALALLVVAGELVRTRLLGTRTPAAAAPAITGSGRAVAVLPFRALGGGNDARVQEVAEALGTEVSTAVAGVGGVRVASQAAVRSLADSSLPPAVLGERLRVTHLVEGSVQRERGILRATVRLVRIEGDSTVWAETLDGSVDSTLAFQARVAGRVSAAVQR